MKQASRALALIFFSLCYLLSSHFAYGFACSGTQNSWMMTGDQSPCDVYQQLIRLCIPTFAVGTLTYGQQYATGPEACGCNTVAASLVAACSDCQNSAAYDGPLYSWYLTANMGGTNHCTSITNGSVSMSVSIPDSLRVDIPAWAYIDINLVGGFWSYNNAYTVAFGGTLTATATPTSTNTGTNTTSPFPTQTITLPATSSGGSVPIGAVIGGVVGGIAVLVGAFIIALLWIRKKKKKATDKALLAHRETPAKSYFADYSQSQSPTTPNYGYVDSTIERSNRPGVLEHNPSSYMAKTATPDPPGTHVPSTLSPTPRSPTFVASEAPPLTYSPPPLAYSPPPTNGNGYYQAPSLPMGGPTRHNQAAGLPDYKTTYSH